MAAFRTDRGAGGTLWTSADGLRLGMLPHPG